ncbi:histidine phosphatase family protein [Lapidilactobacillus wuchangensis]|uniref:histidine phosphatase family protein n=1 Tax=Lapidilactobacillus wuchangensis TaxID=2486001 RepID=UPI000F76EE04|nr:histidine phosphatase family protein [Lapidilactobacillus wuchangensis]
MKNLILVRHGQTEMNAKSRLQGLMDVPLNKKGRQSAQRVQEILAPISLTAAYTSDLSRAVETAEIILDNRQPVVPLQKLPLLREYYFGGLEGQPGLQIFDHAVTTYGLKNTISYWRRHQGFPLMVESFAAADPTKQAESFAALKNRAEKILQLMHDDQHQGNVLLVAHSVLLSMIIYLVAPDDLPKNLLRNASVSILTPTAQGFRTNGINLSNAAEIRQHLSQP